MSRDSDGSDAAAFLQAHARLMEEAESVLFEDADLEIAPSSPAAPAACVDEAAEVEAEAEAASPADQEPTEVPRIRSNLDEMWNLVHEAEVRKVGRPARAPRPRR